MVAVAVRIIVALVLIAGPWTDEPAELDGWDAERFQEIADRDTRAWVDQPIEYPPGSVVVFDLVAGDDVVSTNRLIVALSLVAELGVVAVLWRTVGRGPAQTFLFLGLALVPLGLLRLDMLVTVVAALAAVVLVGPRKRRRWGAVDGGGGLGAGVGFSGLVMIGAMIKLWPALLIGAAWGIGRRHAAVAGAAATAGAGALWLAMVGDGLEPVRQVLSLRGATGWHVESLPGALVSLFGDESLRLELNAFRIGTLRPGVVTAGRVVALLVMALLVVRAARWNDGRATMQRLSLVMIGSVSALLVTAPLLSPQFLLWLTPWGALLLMDEADEDDPLPALRVRPMMTLLATSVVLTGFTLTVFGPPNLAATVPAALLTARNLTLLALPAMCLHMLGPGTGVRPFGTPRETPVGVPERRPTSERSES